MTYVYDDEQKVSVPEGVTLHELPTRKRTGLSWSVRCADQTIGQLDRWSTKHGLRFYRAVAYHPTTGATIRLESSTDMAERIALILDAWRHPENHGPRKPW